MRLITKNFREHLYFLFILLIIVITNFWRYSFGGTGFLAHFADDFFYYLKIAQNIHTDGISSFNKLYLTNGYHPLWMILLVSILKITQTTNTYFFLIFSTIISGLNICVYVFTMRICLYFFQIRLIPIFISTIATIFSIQLTHSGMEIALTIVMMLVILDYCIRNQNRFSEPRVMVVFGFLNSILVLSRLDSAIFVLILILSPVFLDYKSFHSSVKRLLCFSLGGLLVPLYFMINFAIFRTFLPVSGQVKHLKDNLIPNLQLFKEMIRMRPCRIFIIPSIAGIFLSFIVVILTGIWKKKRYIPLFLPVMFCLIYYTILSISSDWHLWQWYAYPFVTCLISVSIIILSYANQRLSKAIMTKLMMICCVVFLMYGMISTHRFIHRINPDTNSIYVAAKKIVQFEENHPGIYAMGDRAGIPGYLMKSPMIQLEGLVMDRKFMQYIASGRNLNDVFEEYKIDYYITCYYKREGNKYYCAEPVQAKQAKFKMKGVLTKHPVLEFTTYDGVCVSIFDLKSSK